jgi:serine/threonine protein kinase
MQLSGQVDSSDGVPLEMIREMSLLQSLLHPNVVRVHEVVLDASQMFMVMELVEYDLGHLIEHMETPFSEAQVGEGGGATPPHTAPHTTPYLAHTWYAPNITIHPL